MTVLGCPSNSGTKHPADSSTQSLVTQPWHGMHMQSGRIGLAPSQLGALLAAAPAGALSPVRWARALATAVQR